MLVTSFIVHIFVVLFICFHIPFICLLNDFTEVYNYLWMAVYIRSSRIVIFTKLFNIAKSMYTITL